MCCVLTPASLAPTENDYFTTYVRVKQLKASDMDDIDSDEDDGNATEFFASYDRRRNAFIAHLMGNFVPVLQRAIVGPSVEATKPRYPLPAPQGAAPTQEVLGSERRAVEDAKSKTPELLEDAMSPPPADFVVVPEDGGSLSSGQGATATGGTSSTGEGEKSPGNAVSPEVESDGDDEPVVEDVTPSEEPTPYFLVLQSISLLRSFIVANFSGVETVDGAAVDIGRASSEDEAKTGGKNDVIDRLPTALFDAVAGLVGDVEYYKRVHHALERAERIALNKAENDDMATMKMKAIREGAIQKAEQARVAGAELLTLMLRSLFQCKCVALVRGAEQRGGERAAKGSSDIPDISNSTMLTVAAEGEAHPLAKVGSVMSAVRHVLRPKFTAKLHPMFVRPTPPSLLLFVGEMLRLFILAPRALVSAGRMALAEDAARRIAAVRSPDLTELDIRVAKDQNELALSTDVALKLVDLNLSLPPPPQAPTTPIIAPAAAEGAVIKVLHVAWREMRRAGTFGKVGIKCHGVWDPACQ